MAKVIKTGILWREATWDRAALDAEKRTARLSFSSEQPVDRFFGVEILDHDPKSVDLSRLNAGAPLLMDHNTRDQIGVIERASVTDKRGAAMVRFSRGARASEIFQDVQDGIRSQVSVGYRVNKMVLESEEKGKETYRVTDWTPMEISLVSVPADPTVGVGRNVDEPQWETRIEDAQTTKSMADQPVITAAPAAVAATPPQIPDHLLSDDVREIRTIALHYKAKHPGIEDLATIAEIGKWPLQRFRDEALKLIPKPPAVRPSEPLDVKVRDLANYSISRAISQMAGREEKITGIERELHDELAARHRWTPSGPRAFLIPAEVMGMNMERSFVAGTGTLGGMIVQTTNLASQFIELLRNKAQVMALGAQTLLLDTPVTIPRQAAAGTANWVGETVAATLGVGNFQQITLQPNGISAFQQYGAQLLATNNPSIDALVRNDITKIIALAIDLAALHGSGSGQPTGIITTSGIGSVLLGTNGLALNNATAYPAMVSLETLVSAANADNGALAYLSRSAHRGALKLAQRFTSTDSPVWTTSPTPGNQDGNGNNDGVINGYRAAVTNQIATNLTTGTATTITSPIFFGNWNELIIGQFNGGATEIIVDPYVLAVNSVVRIIARHWIDIGVRHAASFAVLGGVLGG